MKLHGCKIGAQQQQTFYFIYLGRNLPHGIFFNSNKWDGLWTHSVFLTMLAIRRKCPAV